MLTPMQPMRSPRARRVARWATLTLVLIPLLWAPGGSAVQRSRSLTCRSVHELMGAYLQHHVEYRSLSAELRDRVSDSYLRRVDPARSLFLESEAQEIRESLASVFGEIAQGRCQRLSDLPADRHLALSRYGAVRPRDRQSG